MTDTPRSVQPPAAAQLSSQLHPDVALEAFLELLLDLLVPNSPPDNASNSPTDSEPTPATISQSFELTSIPAQPVDYPTLQPSPPASLAQYLPDLLAALGQQKLEYRLEDLEERMGDPVALAQLLSPVIDQVLQARAAQDKVALGLAIAPVLPSALAHQVQVSPDEIALAIAPTMGQAIKAQIAIEPNKIVDALYPVIGSTIGKYLAETIQAINQQVESTFSVAGIQRRIQARMQGVSEAELILREALPFTVDAIFLIQNASGLVIAEIQPGQVDGQTDGQTDGQVSEQNNGQAAGMESDMVAGMLTAIRSFANDCIARSGSISELDAINYGTAKIILEAAGYCYLAVVITGNPTPAFLKQLRQSLSQILQTHGSAIEQFEGDSATVPADLHSQLAALQAQASPQTSGRRVSPLLAISLILLTAIALSWGLLYQHSRRLHQAEATAAAALAATPELSVYQLKPTASRQQIRLDGRLPNPLLSQRAAAVAQQALPNWQIKNAIVAVDLPPDPVEAAAEVARLTQTLNQTEGVAISSEFAGRRLGQADGELGSETGNQTANQVTIRGRVSRADQVETMTQAYARIPGVRSVASAIRVQSPSLETRFYFESGSTQLSPADWTGKIPLALEFLQQHPARPVRIVGYSLGSESAALGLERARAVQAALVKQGADPVQLRAVGSTDLPPGVAPNQPDWLSQTVMLELITP